MSCGGSHLWSRWTKNNENASWFIAIKHMLRKYDLKEASWYLDNPVKETIWTAIVKKMVYSYWSGSIIQLLPLYKGLNFITVENLKTGMIHPLFKINCRRCSETANKIKAAYILQSKRIRMYKNESYVFFLKKYSDSQCCWKKYSDFGGGKKIWFRVFVIQPNVEFRKKKFRDKKN